MKIVIDAMGTPAESGGMNLYARELVKAWATEFPGDSLVVVGGRWATEAFDQYPNVQTEQIHGTSFLTRLRTQVVTSGRLARGLDADALLSLSPIASPFVPSERRAAVIHDWRHIRRPEEFGAGQRLYRKLWVSSLSRVGSVIAISEKTARETREQLVPRRLIVVPNGGDHPRTWPRVGREPGRPYLLTYGHFVNKRPEPVIESLSLLGDGVDLVVLGAQGTYRDELQRRAEKAGVDNRVSLPGYVEESEYQRLVQNAAVLVLNSSDEGFGLPASEAMYFGTPVVVASDSGLAEIHGSNVIESEPDAVSLARTLGSALSAPHRADVIRTWAVCAASVRAALREGSHAVSHN